MQTDARGNNRVIAYASRKLNAAESNYSVTHQETLAVVWALHHFRDIIFGYPVQVYTDHAAITELFKGRNLTGRLERWFLIIQEYRPCEGYALPALLAVYALPALLAVYALPASLAVYAFPASLAALGGPLHLPCLQGYRGFLMACLARQDRHQPTSIQRTPHHSSAERWSFISPWKTAHLGSVLLLPRLYCPTVHPCCFLTALQFCVLRLPGQALNASGVVT